MDRNRWYLNWRSPIVAFVVFALLLIGLGRITGIMAPAAASSILLQRVLDLLFGFLVLGILISIFPWPLLIAWEEKTLQRRIIFSALIVILNVTAIVGLFSIGQAAADDVFLNSPQD